MNKDNSSKNLDYSIIDNTKEDAYEYIIDSKNILKIESTKKLLIQQLRIIVQYQINILIKLNLI